MKKIKLYQPQDTLKQQAATINQHHRDSILGIELLNEVDEEQVILPQKKHYYRNINAKHIKQKTATEDTTFYKNLNQYQLPVRHVKPKLNTVLAPKLLLKPTLRNVIVSSWQITILFIGILFVGFAKAFNLNRFKQILKSFFSYQIASEIIREEKVIIHRVNILLSSVYLLITGLFMYQIFLGQTKPTTINMGFIFYLKLLTFLVVIYLLKSLFNYVLSVIFNQQSLFFEYIFNLSLFNNLLGLMLIPTVFLFYFTLINSSFLIDYIVIPIFIFVFTLRILRLLKMAISKNISYFYIFLYICTLEILPLVVMIKIFIL